MFIGTRLADHHLCTRANVNIHPMAIWNVIELFRDKRLLSRIRAELTAAEFRGITSSQDVDKLMSLPLLQSIYAETLRLRIQMQNGIFRRQRRYPHQRMALPEKELGRRPRRCRSQGPGFPEYKERTTSNRVLLGRSIPRLSRRSSKRTAKGPWYRWRQIQGRNPNQQRAYKGQIRQLGIGECIYTLGHPREKLSRARCGSSSDHCLLRLDGGPIRHRNTFGGRDL